LRKVFKTRQEIVQARFPVKELREGGYSARELRAEGVSVPKLHAAGYTLREVREAGFSLEEILIQRPRDEARPREARLRIESDDSGDSLSDGDGYPREAAGAPLVSPHPLHSSPRAVVAPAHVKPSCGPPTSQPPSQR
jgi:hypothetical protein